MLIWSTNTAIQSRNTDIATKQYSNSSNSVLHKVQSPWYNTTKHQVTNLKPAAGMCQQGAIHGNTQHNSNSPSHRHTHTQRLKSCGHLSDHKHWADTHTDGASSATPNPPASPAGHGHLRSLPKPVISWSPAQCRLPESSSAVPFLQQVYVSRPSPPIRPLGSRC